MLKLVAQYIKEVLGLKWLRQHITLVNAASFKKPQFQGWSGWVWKKSCSHQESDLEPSSLKRVPILAELCRPRLHL